MGKLQANPSDYAVYRDPYCDLEKTAQLFRHSPSLASCVRRLWFDGYHEMRTNTLIFEIIRACEALRYLTLPLTSLRYGDPEAWSRLLKRNVQGKSLYSLEFLAMDLKNNQILNPANHLDRKPLDLATLTFRNLKRLKIFGDSNHMALTDDDLFKIAHTARNLHEIHVTRTASVTISGVMALASASQTSLRVLEHSPLSQNGFNHPNSFSAENSTCLCDQILHLPKLNSLAISLPTLCIDLFKDHSVSWSGEVQIRANSLCGEKENISNLSSASQDKLWRILDAARSLMQAREQSGANLNIEIFIGTFSLPIYPFSHLFILMTKQIAGSSPPASFSSTVPRAPPRLSRTVCGLRFDHARIKGHMAIQGFIGETKTCMLVSRKQSLRGDGSGGGLGFDEKKKKK